LTGPRQDAMSTTTKAQELRKQTYRGTQLRDSRGIYTWGATGKDEFFPSVTSILSQMAKPALTYWASKSVAEYVARYVTETVPEQKMAWADVQAHLSDIDKLKGVPWEYAEKRRDLGSTFHDIAERYAGGAKINPSVFASDVRPLVEAFLDWVESHKPEWLAMEAGVFNREHNYAGTMDTIMMLHGRPVVLDYKSSKDSYPEHALQLAAYRKAQFLGLADGSEVPMPATEGGIILLVQESGCKALEWECGDAQFEAFLALRRVYDFAKSGLKPKEVKLC
jgi:hypothetical protein